MSAVVYVYFKYSTLRFCQVVVCTMDLRSMRLLRTSVRVEGKYTIIQYALQGVVTPYALYLELRPGSQTVTVQKLPVTV